jgi:uracil-DNA glycosylase
MQPVLIQGSKILIVGEAPGEEEVQRGMPLVGSSGKELHSILFEAGFPLLPAKYFSDLPNVWKTQTTFSLTNVFHERPQNNDLSTWSISIREAKHLINPSLPWQPIRAGTKGLIHPNKAQPALLRLQKEIDQVRPNLIVALGNTALSALSGISGIAKLRGSIQNTSKGQKVLPTYHPAAVLRNYELRPAVVADFLKARHEAEFPEIRLRARKIHINPTLQDVLSWKDLLLKAEILSFDIETKLQQITCIGFSPSPDEAFVIPFWSTKGINYWEKEEDEIQALLAVKEILEGPAKKIAHNGLYDVQYLARYGIAAKNFIHDTMLLHHSLYPALPKALGFIGSIYCTERAWKTWRVRGSDTEELKRDA